MMIKQNAAGRDTANQQGFTIVEMLIATVIFSIVLLICSYAILHVGKVYYKGLITGRTQIVARTFGEDVAHSIQFGARTDSGLAFHTFSSAPVSYSGAGQALSVYSRCLGGVRYSYVLDKSMGTGSLEARHVLWRDRVAVTSPCTPLNLTMATPSDALTEGSSGQDMVGTRMRIPRFEVNETDGLWGIDFVIAHGDNADLFEAGSNYSRCLGVSASGQFCAVSGYKTTVTKRL